MDEKDVPAEKIVMALEDQLERAYIVTNNRNPTKLMDELSIILDKHRLQETINLSKKQTLMGEANSITSHEWYQNFSSNSKLLTQFNEKVKLLRSL